MKTNVILTVSNRIKMMQGVFLGAALLSAAAASLAAESPMPKDLGQFYQQNCTRCHGATGNARDATGKHLRGADFTNLQWQQNTNDVAMAKVIRKGIFFGLAMPSFRDSLSQDEALQMVRDILHKKLGAPISK